MADGLIIGYKSDSSGVSGTALNDYSSTAFLNFATNGYIGLGTNSPRYVVHVAGCAGLADLREDVRAWRD